MMRYLTLLALLLFALPSTITAAERLHIDSNFQFLPLEPYYKIRYAADEAKARDINDPVFDGDLSQALNLSGVAYFEQGIVDLEVFLVNDAPEPRSLILEQRNAFLESLDVYVTSQVTQQTSPSHWTYGKLNQRVLHGASSFLPIVLTPGENRVVIRLRPTLATLQLGLHSPESAARVALMQSIYGLVAYGGILVLIVAASFIFLRLRDASYFYYILYASICCLVNMIMTGWFLRAMEFSVFTSGFIKGVASTSSCITGVLVGAAIFPFVSSYLHIANHHKWLAQFMRINSLLCILGAAVIAACFSVGGFYCMIAIHISRVLGVYTMVVPILVILYFVSQKQRESYFLLLSFSVLSVGGTYWVAGMDHEISQPLWRGYAGTLGMLVEMMLLSIGLGDRYRQIQLSEKEKDLIRQILPENVVKEKLSTGHVKPVKISKSTVVFIDIQDFTEIASSLNPEQVIEYLDVFFGRIDQIIEREKLVKIKTIGDAYMFVGMSDSPDGDAAKACRAALDIIQMSESLPKFGGHKLKIRAGAHTGPIVAGIIGKTKFHYDVWGDTVNIASRLEANGQAGFLKISRRTFDELAGSVAVDAGKMENIKGKGEMETYLVTTEMQPRKSA